MARKIRRHNRIKPEKDETILHLILFIGILFLLLAMSSLLAVYPQKLIINGTTKIGSLDFLAGNTVLINGNQVDYNSGDVITVPREENIRITGQQVSINDESYVSGVRIIKPTIYQNVLFTKKIGSVNANLPSKIIVDTFTIDLIPKTNTIYNVNMAISGLKAQDNYNIELNQGTTYIKEGNLMLQLIRTGDLLSIYIVGFNSYDTITVVEG